MQALLSQLEQLSNCKDMMRQACKKNGLNTALAGELTVAKLKLLNERFNKAYKVPEDKSKTSWIENQLKAYNWILIAVSALENAKIASFNEKQWILLQNIFQNKTLNFLKFEARRFLQQKKSKNKNWSDQQNRLLLKIVHKLQSQDSDKKEEKKQRVHWNEVARALFEQSQQMFFRSAKHCRERWYNYIDPSIKRGKWSETQDNSLIELAKIKGKKWAEIATELHRTEHNVKNRFHSLQIKIKKDTKRNIKPKLKPKIIKTSIQEEPKYQIFPVKQESYKAPMITIAEFPDRLRSKQSKSEAQISNYLEDADNIQQAYRLEDQSRYPKNQLSFFAFSPHNLTPLMGSPSPLTFNIKGFAYSQQSFNDALLKRDSVYSNDKQ